MTAKINSNKIQISVDGLTTDQAQLAGALQHFFAASDPRIFLLQGYAGSGKTFIIRRLAEALARAKRDFALLAPTGRAARILGLRSGFPARTLHSHIYSINRVREYEKNADSFQFQFELDGEAGRSADQVLIVDEASMIGDTPGAQEFIRFGSGRLLTDLLKYARVGVAGLDTRIVFVGDPAQLPPVTDQISPALSESYLKNQFRLDCVGYELTGVVRQEENHPILNAATELRKTLKSGRLNRLAVPENPPAIRAVKSDDAARLIAEALRAKRIEETILITHTNEAALKYNESARGLLFGDEHAALKPGDRLLINANNGLWRLLNGDFVTVLDVGDAADPHPVAMRDQPLQTPIFRKATLTWMGPDNEAICREGLLLENLLGSRERDLTREMQMALYVDFKNRHPKLKPHSREFEMALREDEYFNAVRVKYGYAVTGHKAQGGEWDRVIVDFQSGGGWDNPDYFRWCYTAITRARRELLTVNTPRFVNPWAQIRQVGTGESEKLSVAKALCREDEGVGPDLRGGHPPSDTSGITMDRPPTGWVGVKWVQGQEPLKAKADLFADALRANGFQPGALEHGRFFERYTIQDGPRALTIQVYYDGQFRFRLPQPLPGGKVGADDPTFQKIAALFQAAIPGDGGTPTDGAKPQAGELRVKLEELRADGVEVVRLDSGEYVDRVTVRRAGQVAEIDFHHDAKGRYTSWQVIRASHPVFSGWIAEQVGNLLMTPEKAAVAGMDLLE